MKPTLTENVFIYDRVNVATILVSVNLAGVSTANGFSQAPVFSGDSSNLVYASSASNLPGAGFNEFDSIFALNLSDQGIAGSGGGTNGQWNVQFLNSPGFWTKSDPLLAGDAERGAKGSYQVQFKRQPHRSGMAGFEWQRQSSVRKAGQPI